MMRTASRRAAPAIALVAAALACGLAGPVAADGKFAKGSQVKGWKGLQGRENALFEAKVVDIVCELSGDCPADCGGGARQLGLLRKADGRLLLAAKNAQAQFNGANEDLQAYCGQEVMVDGLLVGSAKLTDTRFYQVHLIKAPGSNQWVKANRWTRAWKRKHPEAPSGKAPWFRRDPAIQAEIDRNGYLGLGEAADNALRKRLFK